MSFLLDVPFTNGTYTHGEEAFNDLYTSGITADSCKANISISSLASQYFKELISSKL